MNTQIMIELFGYLGSLLVVVSMLMSSVVKLRVINTIGSVIFAIYALIIKSYPTALMNFFLVGINIYHLMRITKTENHFALLDGEENKGLITYLLEHYKEDIRLFFPELTPETVRFDTSYIVCCDTMPAGLLLGRKIQEGELEILLDYSTPTYRDCSVGEYLYSGLPALGIHKLTYAGNSQKHIPYLEKMGFIKENDAYVKKI